MSALKMALHQIGHALGAGACVGWAGFAYGYGAAHLAVGLLVIAAVLMVLGTADEPSHDEPAISDQRRA